MAEVLAVLVKWRCKLNLWHRWRTYRTDEGQQYGGQYQLCLDCGKYRDVPSVMPPP